MRKETTNVAHAVIAQVRDLIADMPDTVPVSHFKEERVADSFTITSVTLSFESGDSLSFTHLKKDAK